MSVIPLLLILRSIVIPSNRLFAPHVRNAQIPSQSRTISQALLIIGIHPADRLPRAPRNPRNAAAPLHPFNGAPVKSTLMLFNGPVLTGSYAMHTASAGSNLISPHASRCNFIKQVMLSLHSITCRLATAHTRAATPARSIGSAVLPCFMKSQPLPWQRCH